MRLLDAALADTNLFDAWRKVDDNAGAAGVDGQGADAFRRPSHVVAIRIAG